jgi:hypothetical protein
MVREQVHRTAAPGGVGVGKVSLRGGAVLQHDGKHFPADFGLERLELFAPVLGQLLCQDGNFRPGKGQNPVPLGHDGRRRPVLGGGHPCAS